MDGSVFYWVGGALVVAALLLSYVGVRGKGTFPPSGRAMGGILALLGLLVAATAAYGIANARDEQDHRNKELAEEQAKAEEEVARGEQGGQGAEPGAKAPAAEVTLDVTSPADGSLVYDPTSLQAKTGTITLDYDNPSPVPHSIAIGDEEDQTLVESDVITDSLAEVTAELVPGEYVYFCTVPGHREAGMEGVLTVK